ncbi:hypothetical protein BWI15_10600 [Kribbella sp. ALI-6-A]|uniref:hypothetical protein n=1 Tax=Kribbella sp. ALI-6-A TaxID=1933817 RepID=UPI00097CB08B|nr:hypothetical protein [Kribbella sp. ALI-6-A]ONI73861.1 hypothetical protein BWI15_10600 [Kribbella sp. ALI-6-A]
MIASLLTAPLAVVALAQGPALAAPAAPAVADGVTTTSMTIPAADSPSPTPSLGSTPRTGADGAGDNDGDAADFSQTGLVFISAGAIVLAVGGSVVFYLIRRNRRSTSA